MKVKSISHLIILTLIIISVKASPYDTVFEEYLERNNFLYTSIKYEYETFYSKMFFTPLKNNLIGIEIKVLFNIPIYNYSGYIEGTITSGQFKLSYIFLKISPIQNLKLGLGSFLEYEYLLDYNRLSLGFEMFGKSKIQNDFEYLVELKNINSGLYITKYIPLKYTFTPLTINNKFSYNLSTVYLYFGILTKLDIEYINLANEIYIGFGQKIGYLNLELKNTFRQGNYLDLEILSEIKIDKFLLVPTLGFNYITGIKSEFKLIVDL